MYLITGFEAFGDHAINPSYHGLVLARENGLLPDNVTIAEIPVVWRTAFETLQYQIAECKPEGVLMLGVHPFQDDPPAFRIESTARNRDGEGADNLKEVGSKTSIVADAPNTIPTGLNVPHLTTALTDAGFHVTPSDDAGEYLCNHLFFQCVHTYDFPCGFVHVPRLELMALQNHAQAFGALAHALVEG